MNLQIWTVYYNNDHGHFYSATFYWQRWAHRALQDLQRSTKMYRIVFFTHHTPPHTHSHAHTLVHRRNVMGREGEEDKIIWNLWWVWIYILGKTTVLVMTVTNSLADKSSIHNSHSAHAMYAHTYRSLLVNFTGWCIGVGLYLSLQVDHSASASGTVPACRASAPWLHSIRHCYWLPESVWAGWAVGCVLGWLRGERGPRTLPHQQHHQHPSCHQCW